jgi:hypothetical protein
MTDDTAIVRSGMPSMTIQDAIVRYNTVIEFTKKVMKSGKDYGTIPGTDKPTLLKPGAEKLCSLFGLTPYFVPVSEQVDFDKGFFYFRYRCELMKGGEMIATGVGSCNSHEKKYRYRNIVEWKATDAEKAAAIRQDVKTSKAGKPYTTYVLENPDPAELVNTIDKMAQKRSLIAAILIAANASEFFTQDLEDLDIIEGQFQEVPPMPEPPLKPVRNPQQSAPPEPEPSGPAMSLETAMAVVSSEGKAYGEIDSATLGHMARTIAEKIKKGGYKPDELDGMQFKLFAIRTLLASERPEPGA